MTEEEKKRLEERHLEEQKRKLELMEKVPDWKLFCDLVGNEELSTGQYWKNTIQKAIDIVDDEGVGDNQDRLNLLIENYQLT